MANFKNILLFFLSFLIYEASSISVEEDSPRVNGLRAGNGISVTTPRFSWRLASSIRNDSQTAYQIQVATSSSALSSPDMWDSGKVSSTSISAPYSGITLKSRDIGWWRVRVWDANDAASSWSAVTTFELGLLSPSDWNASWIGNTNYRLGTNSLPIFAKVFNVSCSVTKARLYLLGLGQHAAMVNGAAVSDAVLEPGYSKVASTLFYSSYDIGKLVSQGTNVLGVELGKGEYDPEPGLNGRYMKFTSAAQQLKLISQLEYTCSTGEVVRIGSDKTWLTTVNGPRIESSWYGGEEYDARKEFVDYSKASGNRNGWLAANITTAPGGKLTGSLSPPLKIVQTIIATNVTQIGGQYVFDFGVNFAGWFTFTLDGTGRAGTRIVFQPGELLYSTGLVSQSTSGDPIFDGYTLSGASSESYTPKFMYHGFRYLMVNTTWAPSAKDMTGQVIRMSADPVGSVSTSNALFNSIHQIIDRAVQSNLYSVLTDCPHREKLGWLEESHLVLDPVARGYDIQAYGYPFVQNMGDAQLANGLVPDISPEFVVFDGGFRDEPNWGNTMILMPYIHYRYYGDIDLLSQYYSNMTAYLNYLTTKASGYLLNYGLGDWVTLDNSTPLGVTSTFGYQQAASGLQVIANGLGKTADAATFATLNANIQSAFHAKYFNTTSKASYSSGSQACNALALDMGAVPAEYEAAVLQTLVTSLVNNGYHLTVGEIALPSVFRVLRAYGRNDVIHAIMSLTTGVSYGYQVVHGATSLWEQWLGPDASAGSSLNHFMLGYADNWLLELSGLAQTNTSVAWQTIDYNPIVVGTLTSASSSYRTPRGVASAEWHLSGGALTYAITVPVGTTGLVYFNSSTAVTESSAPVKVGSNGILGSSTSGKVTTVTVGSGSYTFTSVPTSS